MSTDPKSFEWLCEQMLAKAQSIAESLRTGVKAETAVPNLTWNVGRLGAHIVSVPRMHGRAQIEHRPFPNFDKVDEYSDGTAAEVGTTDPSELADLLVPAVEDYLERLGDDGAAPAKFYEHDVTAQQAAAIAFSELLLHHIDLIGATGEPAAKGTVTGDQARAALAGLLPVGEHVVNPAVARKCQGVLHFHLTGSDGGDHYTTTISGDSAITTSGKPPKADFHSRAEPSALFLASMGRGSQAKALLTGQIIGYGRKPLLGYRAQNLYHSI